MNKKGFTLIEIIIVIVILGILATLALPKITGQMEASRAAEAMTMYGVVKGAVSDCVQSGAPIASCTTQAQTGVAVPAGASFTYFTANAAGSISFRARSTSSGADLCMFLAINNPGSVNAEIAAVTYNSDKGTNATDIFRGIVTRTGASAATACTAAAIATAY